MVAPGRRGSRARKPLLEDASSGDIAEAGPTPAGARHRTTLPADLEEEQLPRAGDDPVVVRLDDPLTAPDERRTRCRVRMASQMVSSIPAKRAPEVAVTAVFFLDV